ncbi:MAG: acylphosphatase [Nocardioidaceae bacterium]|nr:acylphosphatase [Nocardioidaceae bacterium]
MTRVLVAVPAHDEADEIGGCLSSVVAAASCALGDGTCSEVSIGVALHRCTDTTKEVVERTIRSWADRVVLDDEESGNVGAVRAGLVRALSSSTRAEPSTTWIFNTDADSRVPEDWITSTLRLVARSDSTAAAGMVDLREWSAPLDLLDEYNRLLATGIRGADHSHVYGANLAVRLDAYDRAGGFRPVHAEDHDLVDRLRLAGESVATLLAPVVLTSAREPGRAAGGLGTLLHDLRLSRDARTDADTFTRRGGGGFAAAEGMLGR